MENDDVKPELEEDKLAIKDDKLALPLDNLGDSILINEDEGRILEYLDIYTDSVKNVTHISTQPWTGCEANPIPNDITAVENLILQFCINYFPLRKNHCSQCQTYIALAQDEILHQRYGHAVVRFKDFSSFVDNVAVSKNKCDFSTGRILELKTLAAERIALCHLLKNNPKLALKYAQKAIIQKPVVAQSHLWRAISSRRLNNLAQCLKSLTSFGSLVSAPLQEFSYQLNEQGLIIMYWKMVVVLLQRESDMIKVLHFPSNIINHLPIKEQQARMSVTFLMNYPLYNCLIQSDPLAVHLLPVGNGAFNESLQEQKQAYGFMNDSEDAHYFARLPENNFFMSPSNQNAYKKLSAKSALLLWQSSAFINSTSMQMSLKPGKGIHEHLLYCYSLINEECFADALPEYESVLADLAFFPVLSDEGWSDKLAAEVDANVEMVESVIEAIKEYNSRSVESSRCIEQIKQWLELSERKFRVKQRLDAEEGSSSNRPHISPKKRNSSKQSQINKKEKQSPVGKLKQIPSNSIECKLTGNGLNS